MKALFLAILAIAGSTIATIALADTYYYDKNGRVIAITYDDGNTVCYTYDNNGNRLTAVSGCKPPPQ